MRAWLLNVGGTSHQKINSDFRFHPFRLLPIGEHKSGSLDTCQAVRFGTGLCSAPGFFKNAFNAPKPNDPKKRHGNFFVHQTDQKKDRHWTVKAEQNAAIWNPHEHPPEKAMRRHGTWNSNNVSVSIHNAACSSPVPIPCFLCTILLSSETPSFVGLKRMSRSWTYPMF
jgi:hypothetical protein